MKKAILATKVGMTQIFNEDGTLTPVTVLQAGPCVCNTGQDSRERRLRALFRLVSLTRKTRSSTKTRAVRKKSSSSRCDKG